MNVDLSSLTNPHAILVSMVIVVLMGGVKATPFIPNWTIPYIAYVVGAVGYSSLAGWNATNFFTGILAGAGAVGLHQGVVQAKSTLTETEPKEPQNE